jgi:hypothetical protein
MARDPMMQQSPAMPDMAGANMRGGNPMQDLPQKGKDNLAKPQAEIAAVLVARLGLMSPQELEMLDLSNLRQPQLEVLLKLLLPELAELIDAGRVRWRRQQPAGPQAHVRPHQPHVRHRPRPQMGALGAVWADATTGDSRRIYPNCITMLYGHALRDSRRHMSPVDSEKLTAAISTSLCIRGSCV